MPSLGLSEGDICPYRRSNGNWGFFWVLKIDPMPSGESAYSLRKLDVHSTDEVLRSDVGDVEALKGLSLLGHFPIVGERVAEADPRVIGGMPVNEAHLQGYRLWREAYDKGEGGVFTLALEEI